ncbi:hypothetical protein HBZS_109730 [Helicobacter bizzozeronii CCUG 35545]|nr:hypothetical protein HBZS_109730 [Helicobacter bizzozeronii CCUG 35545]
MLIKAWPVWSKFSWHLVGIQGASAPNNEACQLQLEGGLRCLAPFWGGHL